nr:MAG TPA: SCIMP protein [Caudoviricetes sp.]
MKLLKKYKWYILTIIVLFCLGLMFVPRSGKESKETKQSKAVKVIKHTTKPSKHSSSSTSKTSSSSSSEQPQQPQQPQEQTQTEASQPQQEKPIDGVGPTQSQVDQATEQYGYTPGYGGVPSDSPEVAREQADQQARQNWHDSQVEWARQQGLMD